MSPAHPRAQSLVWSPLWGSPPGDAQLCRVRCTKSFTNGWSRASTTQRTLLLQALRATGGRRIASKSIPLSRRRSSLQLKASFTWWRAGSLVQSRGASSRYTRDIDGWGCVAAISQPVLSEACHGLLLSAYAKFCNLVGDEVRLFQCLDPSAKTLLDYARAHRQLAQSMLAAVEVNLSWPRLAHRCRTNASALGPTVSVNSRFSERAVLNKLRCIAARLWIVLRGCVMSRVTQVGEFAIVPSASSRFQELQISADEQASDVHKLARSQHRRMLG